MLIGTIGDLGTGKTLFTTFLGLFDYFCGRKIYANYELQFPYQKIISLLELDIQNNNVPATMLFDEIWSLADSRKSMSKTNDYVNIILLASRKTNFNIYWNAQLYSQADKRIRDVTNYYVYPTIEDNILTATIIDKKGTLRVITVNPYPLFDLYDTNEVIDNKTIESMDKKIINTVYINKLRKWFAENPDYLDKPFSHTRNKLVFEQFKDQALNRLVYDELVEQLEKEAENTKE